MKKLYNIRHWDLALIWINKLPKWLTKTKSNILMKWNNWHNHTFDNWVLYIIKDSDLLEEKDFIFWYFIAKDTILFHEDHWDIIEWNTRTAKIPNGIYELRKQKEYTPDWLKPVID